MPEQTEERPFTAEVADAFARAAVDDAAGTKAYTMALRCIACYVEMVPQLTEANALPEFACPKCHIAVEVSFS